MTRARRAEPADTDAVRGVLTAALLEPPPSLADAVAAGQVHVVGGGPDGTHDADPTTRVVGCLVRLAPARTPDAERVAACVETLDPTRRPFDPEGWRDRTAATHVDSVAVTRGRRGDGVGTTLVEAAADAAGLTACPLTVAFRPAVAPFYESLGFSVVSPPDGERLVGWRPADDG
ncbi:MAG: acetyltransferase (GNAT) family [halophilic archaeon J07HB67]|nr:MAG: acetyltransferase (GNAT) family [halophilic archaeon J07HB67]